MFASACDDCLVNLITLTILPSSLIKPILTYTNNKPITDLALKQIKYVYSI